MSVCCECCVLYR